MIRHLVLKGNRLPLKWRMTLWSSLLLFMLFLLYSAAQYVVFTSWTKNQEELAIRKSLDDIQGYFAESVDLTGSRAFLDKVNQNNQMIRILDEQAQPILIISDDVPQDWVGMKTASGLKLIRLWHNHDHLLVLRAPLTAGSFKGTVEIVRNLEEFERLTKFVLLVMLIGGIVAVVISGFAGMLLARQFIKPVSALKATMERIKISRLSERVEFVDNHDEFSALSRMFNEMMDQLEQSFLRQKQFVEDASHELRTPIAIVEGHLSLLARWGKDNPSVLNESLQVSLQEMHRLKDLTQELLALSRADAFVQRNEEEWANPVPILKRIIDDFTMLYPEFEFELDLQPLSAGKLGMSEYHLKQVMLILLDNTVKYSDNCKIVSVSGQVIAGSTGRLKVIDYGIGIPKEEITHVFDRFYRVDKARSRKRGGSGLGLSIAKRLVENGGGVISISSTEQEGTVVTLDLPFRSHAE